MNKKEYTPIQRLQKPQRFIFLMDNPAHQLDYVIYISELDAVREAKEAVLDTGDISCGATVYRIVPVVDVSIEKVNRAIVNRRME